TRWVKIAWDQVDSAYIRRSFKCCGISIAQDRSEQDMMFDYEWAKNPEVHKPSLGEDRYKEGDMDKNEEDTYYKDEMIEYDNI
ncbi:23881_t:CDS:2, partial [Cetraspora pellucida]